MGDALSHSVVPGVAGAYALGLPYAAGAFFTGMLAALAMTLVRHITRLREDAIIGFIFSTFFAVGLLIVSLNPTSVNVQSIIFGNILGIADEDVLQVEIIIGVSLLILCLVWKDLLAVFFDESHAVSIGLSPLRLKILFFTLLSACTVAALQTVGAILVIAMVITPGATAYLLTDRFSRLVIIAIIIGALTSGIGAYLSFFLDGATGGDRHPANAGVPGGVLLRAETRPAGVPAPRGAFANRRPLMDTLYQLLSEPFAYPFMQRAIVAAIVTGVVCAVLSCYLVLKGWSLMGDAISHAVLPGIVVAFVVGIPLAIGAFLSGIFCAVATGLPEREQPGERRHGDGHRLFRHVRLRPGAVLTHRYRPTPEPHFVRQHAGHYRRRAEANTADRRHHLWRWCCSSAKTSCCTASIRIMRG